MGEDTPVCYIYTLQLDTCWLGAHSFKCLNEPSTEKAVCPINRHCSAPVQHRGQSGHSVGCACVVVGYGSDVVLGKPFVVRTFHRSISRVGRDTTIQSLFTVRVGKRWRGWGSLRYDRRDIVGLFTFIHCGSYF